MPIERRPFGPEAIPVSLLGFGCGNVGGLMVRGTEEDQQRAVRRALEAGINYFDTAARYGDGLSERNLGRTLRQLGSGDVLVGTKVLLHPTEFGQISAAVSASLEASLRRLQRDCVDIFHLHNAVTMEGGGESLSVRQVLEEVAPAFQSLRTAGKLRLPGLTAIGETTALQQVIDSGLFGSAQVAYNMLNPSAGATIPVGYPAQDYGRLLEHAKRARAGVVGIRVLAGGALSGAHHRHPVASPAPAPIGSGRSYDTDVGRATQFTPLVTEAFAASLPEAAVRFAIAHPAMGTILVGTASLEEFETALDAVAKGPLPQQALDRIGELAAGFSG